MRGGKRNDILGCGNRVCKGLGRWCQVKSDRAKQLRTTPHPTGEEEVEEEEEKTEKGVREKGDKKALHEGRQQYRISRRAPGWNAVEGLESVVDPCCSSPYSCPYSGNSHWSFSGWKSSTHQEALTVMGPGMGTCPKATHCAQWKQILRLLLGGADREFIPSC